MHVESFATRVAIICCATLAGAFGALAEYREAPDLAKQVQAGTLPPVDKRLPEKPLVIQPYKEVGKYGGTWRSGTRERMDSWMIRTVGFDGLVIWKPDWSGVQPNVAESFEVKDEGRTYVFHLRKGLRWSDGDPFDADDLMFAYEDVWQNKALPTFPSYMVNGKTHAEMKKIDQYTVSVSFAQPRGTFLQELTTVDQINGGHALVKYPAHYMKQFHIKYNPQADALAKQAGYDGWASLFEAKASFWESAKKPTLNAWIITQGYGQGTQVVAERNPYYWKVDNAGNQLPYIDRVVFDVFQDDQVLLLRAMNGEIDVHMRHINTLENQAVLYDNREKGKYHFVELLPAGSNECGLPFNLTHVDPVKREILNNKNLRIGLSYAINREDINQTVYFADLDIQHVAVRRTNTALYNPRLATQYTEYNKNLANEYLDKAGYSKRNSNGIRLGPDGKPIVITILARTDKQDIIDCSKLVVRDWREVGIDARLDVAERSLVRARRRAGDVDISADDFGGGNKEAFFLNNAYIPNSEESLFGLRWANWYLNQGNAEEPPAAVKQQLALYDKFRGEPEEQKQIEIFRQILDIAADQFYMIGIGVPKSPGYGIVTNRMRNVPDVMEGSYAYAFPAPVVPAQFWIATP